MNEQRRYTRMTPPLGEQLVALHGYRKHVFGRVVDESSGGLGIHLADPEEFRIGERLLIHRLHQSRIRLDTVRHVDLPHDQGTRMGVQWSMH